MNKYRYIQLLVLCLFMTSLVQAQDSIPLWQNSMPNSKGMKLANLVVKERVVQVGTPFMQVFEPSVAERTGTAVLIIPGGGYVRLAHEISGIALAKWFNTFGVTAFVLYHRFPQSPDVVECFKAPLQDGQRAMRIIRANAAKYGIRADKIGVMGSSAGGHLAASLCTLNQDWSLAGDSLDRFPFKPSFAILVSPVISLRTDSTVHKGSRSNLLGAREKDQTLLDLFSLEHQVKSDTPPALLILASNDNAVSPLNSLRYYEALLAAGVTKSSLHVFSDGKHAISLRKQPGSTSLWPSIAEEWLIENGFSSPL
jgi:acetyl esterase/lipase